MDTPQPQAAEREQVPLILPVGHYLGPFHPGAGEPAQYHRLRIGRTPMRLFTEEEVAAWGLAHSLPGRFPPGTPWTRATLLAAAGDYADKLTDVLDVLLTDGVLVEVSPGTRGARDFAERYRLVPLMVGLGEDPANRGRYLIGLFGSPALSVDRPTYELWTWADLPPTLWATCELIAAVATEGGTDLTDPAATLTRVLGGIHVLLGPNAAYLDLAAPPGDGADRLR